jgi:glycerol uptake facilitator-like aquaporin
MAERLASGNVAIALLANSIATGAALVVLISVFAPVSQAHFNPVVTLAAALAGSLKWRAVAGYLSAQASGAFGGVALAHAMFGLPLFATSHHPRTGSAQVLAEAVATFGLVLAVSACSRLRLSSAPYIIGAYITSAYWFTSSTSFANPVVTLARTFTDTFAGIRPSDTLGFYAGQFAGALAAAVVARGLWPSEGLAAWEGAENPMPRPSARSAASL